MDSAETAVSERVREYYDWLATIYDETTAACEWAAPSALAQVALPLVSRGDAVLDLGIGTGQSAEPFLDAGCRCWGLDIAAAMLKEAKVKHPALNLVRADLDSPHGWPLADTRFNLAISSGVYECLRDPIGFLDRVHDLLLPGGHLVFTFDEYVPGHAVQGVRVGRADSGIPSPISDIAGWPLRRHSLPHVADWLNDQGFDLLKHSQIVADYHSYFEVAIYYRLVVARRRG